MNKAHLKEALAHYTLALSAEQAISDPVTLEAIDSLGDRLDDLYLEVENDRDEVMARAAELVRQHLRLALLALDEGAVK